jgi:uncharacterized iron-regulated membrane protein
MRSVRAQGGFVAARLLLALVASTGVTAAVAGPMAYQSHQASVRAEQREQQRPQPTVTTEPAPDPNVLGETTVPLPGETSTVAPPSTVVPRSTTQPGGGVTAPRPTTAPAVTAPADTAPTPTDAPQIEPVPRGAPPTTDDGQGG